jgi:hypothetical protein
MSDAIIRSLHWGVFASFDLALLALPFLVVNWVRQLIRARVTGKKTVPLKSVLFFVIPIVFVFIFENVIEVIVRHKLHLLLRSLSSDRVILVNGLPASSPEVVIGALQKVQPTEGHHSHPTRRINVDIKAHGGAMTLVLGRDSDIPQEYWVFSPAPPFSWGDELGRITTKAFDDY